MFAHVCTRCCCSAAAAVATASSGATIKVMSWSSSYLENVIAIRRCCCSAEIDDVQTKGAPLLVPAEWSACESNAAHIGPLGESIDLRAPPAARSRGPIANNNVEDEGSTDACNEVVALRDLMKRFVREMVQGKEHHVVIEGGQTAPCVLSLTQNLMCLRLEAGGVNHDIPLKNVKDVCSGKLMGHSAAPIELDRLCSTMVLRNNTCVTFRLRSVAERDDFTKCIKVLALTIEQ